MTLTLQELAKLCDAEIQGNPALDITAAADIMTAVANQVTVLSSSKYTKYLNKLSLYRFSFLRRFDCSFEILLKLKKSVLLEARRVRD